MLAIQQNKSVLLNNGEASTPPGASAETQSPFDKVPQRCLNAAVRQWDSVAAQSRSYLYYEYISLEPSSSKISRVIQLADFCVLTGHLKSGESLRFGNQQPGGLAHQVQDPLHSVDFRAAAGVDEKGSGHVFLSFRRILSDYHWNLPSAHPWRQTRVLKTRKIGCGCVDYRAINTFLFSASSQETFRYAQSQRTHMEGYLRAAPDLVTYSTIRSGSPHGLVVTKGQDIVAAAQWLIRQGEVKTFLGK